jgi:hypothetical protein
MAWISFGSKLIQITLLDDFRQLAERLGKVAQALNPADVFNMAPLLPQEEYGDSDLESSKMLLSLHYLKRSTFLFGANHFFIMLPESRSVIPIFHRSLSLRMLDCIRLKAGL